MDISKVNTILFQNIETGSIKPMNNHSYFKDNKEYCVQHIGSGASGSVYTSQIPSSFTVDVRTNTKETKKIIIPRIAIKQIMLDLERINPIFVEDDDKILYLNHPGGEAFISYIFSKCFIDGLTPHFPIYYEWSMCATYAIIMYENLSTKFKDTYISSLDNYHELFQYLSQPITAELIEYCIISILHTIYIMQYNFSTIHGDIAMRNILIKLIDNKPYFRGKNMKKIKYFEYVINEDTSLYVPFKYGFLLKIGDFGSTINYINNKIVINVLDQQLGGMHIVQKYYPEYPKDYDVHFPDYYVLLREFVYHFGGISDILINLIRKLPPQPMNNYSLLEYDKKTTWNVDKILTDKIFAKYHTKPDDFDEHHIKIRYTNPSS